MYNNLWILLFPGGPFDLLSSTSSFVRISTLARTSCTLFTSLKVALLVGNGMFLNLGSPLVNPGLLPPNSALLLLLDARWKTRSQEASSTFHSWDSVMDIFPSSWMNYKVSRKIFNASRQQCCLRMYDGSTVSLTRATLKCYYCIINTIVSLKNILYMLNQQSTSTCSTTNGTNNKANLHLQDILYMLNQLLLIVPGITRSLNSNHNCVPCFSTCLTTLHMYEN